MSIFEKDPQLQELGVLAARIAREDTKRVLADRRKADPQTLREISEHRQQWVDEALPYFTENPALQSEFHSYVGQLVSGILFRT